MLGSSNHNTTNSTEEVSRGVAVEKLDSVKKWGINTYKVLWAAGPTYPTLCHHNIVYAISHLRDILNTYERLLGIL